ncbi:MAG: hypothetical protein AAGK78_08330, partial [Planctomycetota bacterium]
MNQLRNSLGTSAIAVAAMLTLGICVTGCAEMNDIFNDEVSQTRQGIEDRMDARKANAEQQARDTIAKPGDKLDEEMDKIEGDIDQKQAEIEGDIDEAIGNVRGD